MRISRRELLATLLGAPLAGQLAACETERPPASPDAIEGGFVEPDHRLGHRLRTPPPPDAAFADAPTERVDVAIVGGGPAGLAAAWRLARRSDLRVRLLELEPHCGGTARGGRDQVTPYPWAAHYITTPLSDDGPLPGLLRELDVLEPSGPDGRLRAREQYLVRQPRERLFYRGYWYPGLYPRVGANAEDLAQLARFEREVERLAAQRDARGRRAFAIPIASGSDDAEWTALDRISAADWMGARGLTSPRLRFVLDYACRDDFGLRLEHASAWALLHYHASRRDVRRDYDAEVITWPQGNAALTDHMRAVAGDAVRTGKLVVGVVPARPESAGGGEVAVHVIDGASGGLERVLARRVVVAAPRFVAARIVRAPQPLSTEGFEHGAWMVANLHLRSRPGGRGCEPAWDNVLHDSPALGYVTATHQRGRDHGPTVWSYYLPMTDADPRNGRRRLMQVDWAGHRDAVLADLGRAHPDLVQHVERIDVCRWGHGMVQPRVGTVFGAARRRAARPVAGVHFAHSDLSGVALFEEAFHHGVRAADEVRAGLRAAAEVPT
ncbi:MAG: FAD-dependent oxidoreductase [Myxococcales bacterium]|jgi:phytoene dehydrogenase-like protein